MLPVRNSSQLLLALLVIVVVGVLFPISLAQQDSWEGDYKATPAPGKRAFASTCAGCHGLDGRGTEKAPNITSSTKMQRLSDARIANIISNGIPGTGMPAFRTLSAAQVHSLVSYLRKLQGEGEARTLPGDSRRGKKIFFGKGECSNCHAISGEGGFLGPDLTAYGSLTSATSILEGILKRDRIVPAGYKSAIATTRDGGSVEGVVRNEDNFSVQVQTKDGSFHLVQKADLEKLEYLPQPLMPTDYGERLSRPELKDLVSYLMSPGLSSGKAVAPNATEADPK